MSPVYIDARLLSYPGTANHDWREEMADAFERGYEWLEHLAVVIVGGGRMTSEIDAAMHAWNARVLFAGSSGWTAFVRAAALDAQPPYPAQVLLLHERPERSNRSTDDRLVNLRLHTDVRRLPCPNDVVTPVVPHDLLEVFANVARR